MKLVQLLWFEGCPNHLAARTMIDDVLREGAGGARFEAIEVADDTTAARRRFPGSPTIRVDGNDIEPGYEECDDCTPRCRVYATPSGLRGVPERAWLERALLAPPGDGDGDGRIT